MLAGIGDVSLASGVSAFRDERLRRVEDKCGREFPSQLRHDEQLRVQFHDYL